MFKLIVVNFNSQKECILPYKKRKDQFLKLFLNLNLFHIQSLKRLWKKVIKDGEEMEKYHYSTKWLKLKVWKMDKIDLELLKIIKFLSILLCLITFHV
jgi:hypothetical protein